MKLLRHHLTIKVGIALSGIYFSSCVSTSPFHFSKKLIRNWSYSLTKEEPAPYPFLVTYQKGRKTLRILAVTHENQLQSRTFQFIKSALASYPPQIALLEGFPASYGLTPSKMSSWSKNDGQKGFYQKGETAFAIQILNQMNTPFAGLEIDDHELKEQLIRLGYSEHDIIYFYFLRQIPQLKRSRATLSAPLTAHFSAFTDRVRQELRLNRSLSFSLSQFREWFAAKNKINFDLNQIDAEMTAPLLEGSLYTQKLSSAIGRLRDQYMVTAVAKMLDQYDDVLAVYGGSHWVTQSKVFDFWFGTPKRIEPNLPLF